MSPSGVIGGALVRMTSNGSMEGLAAGATVGIVVLWRHDSLAQIVTSVVAVSLSLTAAGLVMDRRKPASVPVPMESAE